jgi:hypothetical protein
MNNNILIIIGTVIIVYLLLKNNKLHEKFSNNNDSGNILSRTVVAVTNILPDVLQKFIKNTATDVVSQFNTPSPTPA